MTSTSPVIYDPSTDSMYVTLREGRVAHTITHDERDFAIDMGEDGEPMGYDIQFASRHPDVIAEALRLLQQGGRRAA
ncbi:DUF2283 domain-containing protein [Paramagnetospirillum marisnigri]|nr:DUF2283 domain-containing protein [Paramagnetospirillum marisnigri]